MLHACALELDEEAPELHSQIHFDFVHCIALLLQLCMLGYDSAVTLFANELDLGQSALELPLKLPLNLCHLLLLVMRLQVQFLQRIVSI